MQARRVCGVCWKEIKKIIWNRRTSFESVFLLIRPVANLILTKGWRSERIYSLTLTERENIFYISQQVYFVIKN